MDQNIYRFKLAVIECKITGSVIYAKFRLPSNGGNLEVWEHAGDTNDYKKKPAMELIDSKLPKTSPRKSSGISRKSLGF
jgi:hypothetical protein